MSWKVAAGTKLREIQCTYADFPVAIETVSAAAAISARCRLNANGVWMTSSATASTTCTRHQHHHHHHHSQHHHHHYQHQYHRTITVEITMLPPFMICKDAILTQNNIIIICIPQWGRMYRPISVWNGSKFWLMTWYQYRRYNFSASGVCAKRVGSRGKHKSHNFGGP